MKKLYIVVLLFLGSLTACNDWLDVTPMYDIEEGAAFASEDGYNTALNGLYQTAAKSSLYGKELSWGMLSGMSQDYDYLYSANTRGYGSNFDYTNVTYTKPAVQNIWEGLYNIVANANILIKNVKDCDPGLFTLDTLTKDRIYGEALGMRAIMHLDIVRLFAPAPSSTGGQEKLVPYQNTWPSEFTVPVTTMETLDLIIEDLKKAAVLLAPHDTIYKRTNSTTWALDDYKFRSNWNRAWNFNYPSAVIYLSRAYMLKGDYQNALHYAKHFYDRFTYIGRGEKAALCTFSDGTAGGQSSYKAYKAFHECTFALYQPDLLDMVQAEFDQYGVGIFFQGIYAPDAINIRFGADMDDIRLDQFEVREVEDSWQDVWELTYTKRYDEKQHSTYDFEREGIPMVRMAEIYYNMIECYYRLGNTTEALRLLNEWRKGKKMSRMIDEGEVLTLTDLQDIIINDARREYITEGEVFHICKRMNRPLIDNFEGTPIVFTDEQVTLPIPDSQDL